MKARTIAVGLLAAACLTGCGRQPASAQQNGGTDQAAPAAQTTQAAYADTALVGNSYIESFFTYDALPGAACFYRVGLNVNSVFEQPMLQGEDTQTPVIGLLEGRDFANIVFFFGENELGWSNRQAFTEQYGRVIDAARAACPDAVIYLAANPPVSAEMSAKNEDNTNNASIRACNAEIAQVAQENGAVYVDSFAALAGTDGCLPADAAADGIHPAKEYTAKWADLLKREIAEAQSK